LLLNVRELVKKEKEEGMKTIIFAYDELDYALQFYAKCLEEEIKPIIGQKITMDGQEVVLLCKDSEGYRILCRHSADSERTFTKEESSHFIFTTLKDCNNFDKQIPYIFPTEYFSKENLYKRQIDNLPDVPFPAGIGSAAEYLECLVNIGVKYRYETSSLKVQMRVKQELDAILSNHLEKYFLVIWEMTAMCRKRGIIYSTFSDESNCSMICYVLRITDVDPLKYNLYFEFLLDPGRGINPKINLFVSKNIIQHLRNIYGTDCVAYKIKKVEWERNVPEYRLGRNLIIAKNPICNYMPVYESQRGLAGWNDEYADVTCFNVVQVDHWKGYSSVANKTFHTISFTDLKTMNYVKKNRAKIYAGYWFSDKAKKRLKDFRLNSFADLVIVEAILNIYPDDFSENLLSDIIKRQKKGYKPLFDGSDEILGETYGKILFIEQFIHIVQLAAGWDFAKADIFRRDMGKRKAVIEAEKEFDEFMECAVGRGFSTDSAIELFMTLFDSAAFLVSKVWCLGQAKSNWQDSYLKAYYSHVFISKSNINIDK
jgi:DNA polymerase III alpha subunit